MKMPRHWIEHVPDWRDEPMAYWVHIEQGDDWLSASCFKPPAPTVILHYGYPVLCVESQGFVFRFSSFAQLLECVDVLGRTPLPTSTQRSLIRPDGSWPNSQWLSRLPGQMKAPKARRRAVADLSQVIASGTPKSVFWPER